jgi:hypothetical protein
LRSRHAIKALWTFGLVAFFCGDPLHAWCVTYLVRRGTSMKPRHPNLEWIKKVLADLERNRGDPQIAALMGRQMGDHQMGDLVETSAQPERGAEPAPEPLGKSSSRAGTSTRPRR